MQDLTTTDRMHVTAADCWISVGNIERAKAELAEVGPLFRDHPDVLQVHWHLHAQMRDWETSVKVAMTLTETTPERTFGWVHLSLSLRRLGKFPAAIEVLRRGIEVCGKAPTLLLNMACCHACLGKLSQAKEYPMQALEFATDQDSKHRFLLRAFNESDLMPVWQSDPSSLVGIP